MQHLKLLSGFEMPIFGLGTWKSKAGEAERAVRCAVEAGYRHIDCAHAYCNEGEVGAALKDVFARKVMSRDEVFVTSKLWVAMMRPDLVKDACKTSLANLGLEYLDLYLIHWPIAFKEGGELFPRDAEGNVIFSEVDFLDTWKAMEELVDGGLVRSIGLSNFNRRQIQRVWDNARVKPSVLQVEIHPYHKNLKLAAFAKSLGIQVTAYSPLGSPDSTPPTEEKPGVLKEPVVERIAQRIGKSVPQVLIRYCIEREISVIPKSVTPKWIEQNMQALDFNLSKEDMDDLNGLPDCHRTCVIVWASAHPHYPFHDEY